METEKQIKSEIDKFQSEGNPVPDSVIAQIAQGGIRTVINLLLLLFESKNRWKKFVKEQLQQLNQELDNLKNSKAETGNEALLHRISELERRQTSVDETLDNMKQEVSTFMTEAKNQLEQLPEKLSEELKQQAEEITDKIMGIKQSVDDLKNKPAKKKTSSN